MVTSGDCKVWYGMMSLETASAMPWLVLSAVIPPGFLAGLCSLALKMPVLVYFRVMLVGDRLCLRLPYCRMLLACTGSNEITKARPP